jgi:hypothetical protein
MVDLQEDIDTWYKRIDEATREITEVRQQVEQMVQAAANRFLVNEQGQPVDGALYWWRQMAIVRLGTRLELIPLQTMDEEKIWPNGNDPLRQAPFDVAQGRLLQAQEVPQDTAYRR